MPGGEGKVLILAQQKFVVPPHTIPLPSRFCVRGLRTFGISGEFASRRLTKLAKRCGGAVRGCDWIVKQLYLLCFYGAALRDSRGKWSLPGIDADEPRMAEAAREMPQSGDFLVPR